MDDQIVLPLDAVVKEGPDSYVFQQNGEAFQRVAVHERYRDQTSVVIMNDGAIYPGDVIARKGAHQMQMALKNKASGGVDLMPDILTKPSRFLLVLRLLKL